jgi:hypothetical protein
MESELVKDLPDYVFSEGSRSLRPLLSFKMPGTPRVAKGCRVAKKRPTRLPQYTLSPGISKGFRKNIFTRTIFGFPWPSLALESNPVPASDTGTPGRPKLEPARLAGPGWDIHGLRDS